VIAHNLFEAMQVMIGSINAFTQKCVIGISANREKAEGWLDKNAIVITALNPIIGYAAGAALVKEALARNESIRKVATEKASKGELKHIASEELVSPEQVEAALSNLRKLTEGGIAGTGGGG
jgi:fumarate hydratase class II